MDAPEILLRDYQQALIDRIRASLPANPRTLAQAPTGAGKTVLAAYMISGALRNGKRCYFACHRQELVDQTSITFKRVGIDHSFIAAGYEHDASKAVQIVSVDTIRNRLDRVLKPDLVIVDEAHHVVAKTWTRVFKTWPDAMVVGLTATPERLDGRGLGEYFDNLVLGPPVLDLIKGGFLNDYKVLAPNLGLDLSRVRKIAGEFARDELASLMDNADLIGGLVDHWKANASHHKTLVFATSVDHSKHITDAFNRAGVPAIHLDATTPKKERRAALLDFALGKYKVVSNCMLFGEGFDAEANANSGRPAGTPWLNVTVGCVVSARPTQSLGIWLQQIGRALRPQTDKAIILDHAGNVFRHGLPCDEREWSLDATKRKPKAIRVKTCDRCFAVVPPQEKACPECGHVFPKPKGREFDHLDGDLTEVDVEARRVFLAEYKAAPGNCATLDELAALGSERKYRNPRDWAAIKWKEMGR